MCAIFTHPFVTILPCLALFAAKVNGVSPPEVAPSTQQSQSVPDPGFHVDVKQVVEFLASDEQEGRGVGSNGLVSAGDYVAHAFSSLGLKPLPGLDGYFQPFQMVTATAPDPKTFLSMGDKKYEIDNDYAIASFSGEGAFEGPVVFIGYGISSKEHTYDDFAGFDLKGKIALAMRFEPHNEKGTSRFAKDDWSVEATLAHKAKAAADHGALALVLVNPPAYHPGDLLLPFARRFPGGKSTIPVMQVKEPIADAWLKAGGVADLKTLQATIDKESKPATIALANVSVKGNIAIQRTEKTVRNVIGLLPGKGPHADEIVVIGAHYDHLGHGGPGSLAPGSHAIFHGADDNASGTATMMKLADYFTHQGPQERTLLFAAWTAEEEGLIGSQHFVEHPPIPLDRIVADLNLDMVGRIRANVVYIGGAGTAPAFDKLLEDADKGFVDHDGHAEPPFELKSFGRGGYGPSDHMSFAMHKIPVLFFFSGMHADYHRPTDTSDKINYAGMEEVAQFGEKLVTELTEMPRQTYIEVADSGNAMAHMSGGGTRVTLGVVPDYSEGTEQTTTKGVRISGTVPGSPAAGAGLKEGDIIVQFGADKVDSLYDLSDELGKSKPGDKVKLGVMRAGKRVELEATLSAKSE